MAINIRIAPSAYGSGGPLEEFASSFIPPQRRTEKVRLADASPGFIASAPRITGHTNIREDGSFPPAPPTTESNLTDLMVHISPTSGSSVVRGGSNWDPSQAEYDPTYGLNVPVGGITLQSDVFETALNEPVGMQFRANLQDLVARGVIEVRNDGGTLMTPGDIAAYTAP